MALQQQVDEVRPRSIQRVKISHYPARVLAWLMTDVDRRHVTGRLIINLSEGKPGTISVETKDTE